LFCRRYWPSYPTSNAYQWKKRVLKYDEGNIGAFCVKKLGDFWYKALNLGTHILMGAITFKGADFGT
jgi:hypothetical protein